MTRGARTLVTEFGGVLLVPTFGAGMERYVSRRRVSLLEDHLEPGKRALFSRHLALASEKRAAHVVGDVVR